MRHLNALYPILLFVTFCMGGFIALALTDLWAYFDLPVTLSALSVAVMGGSFAGGVLTYAMFVESILEEIAEENLIEVKEVA